MSADRSSNASRETTPDSGDEDEEELGEDEEEPEEDEDFAEAEGDDEEQPGQATMPPAPASLSVVFRRSAADLRDSYSRLFAEFSAGSCQEVMTK